MMAIGANALNTGLTVASGEGSCIASGLTQSNALPAASFPVAQLPGAVDIIVVANAAKAVNAPPVWAVQNIAMGSARINLGGDYALNINQTQREVTIENRATNETTRIFGNATVEVDGQRAYQFWGTTSFELANGVKITANTVADAANSGGYLLDKLTVTGENHAVIVSNLSDASVQKVSARVIDDATKPAEKSWAVDDDTRDGFVLQENEAGSGWLIEGKNIIATQADLNATAVGRAFAPGSERMSNGEFGIFFNRIITQFMMFTTGFSMRNSATEMRNTDRNSVDENRSASDKSASNRALENRRIIEMQSLRQSDTVQSLSEFAAVEAMAA